MYGRFISGALYVEFALSAGMRYLQLQWPKLYDTCSEHVGALLWAVVVPRPAHPMVASVSAAWLGSSRSSNRNNRRKGAMRRVSQSASLKSAGDGGARVAGRASRKLPALGGRPGEVALGRPQTRNSDRQGSNGTRVACYPPAHSQPHNTIHRGEVPQGGSSPLWMVLLFCCTPTNKECDVRRPVGPFGLRIVFFRACVRRRRRHRLQRGGLTLPRCPAGVAQFHPERWVRVIVSAVLDDCSVWCRRSADVGEMGAESMPSG